MAVLHRFIACHTLYLTHVTLCGHVWQYSMLLFKQKKYYKCFPSRCWYVHSDILKEKTALDAKMYLCTPTAKLFLWKHDVCDCRFWNSATLKSQHIPMHRLFSLQKLKKWPSYIQFSLLVLSFHLVCYKENQWQFFKNKFLKKKNNSFTTSHTSKEILKLKYSVNYKTSVLLLLIVVAKKKPRALSENDVHVHFFMESPNSKHVKKNSQSLHCHFLF